MDKQAKGKLAKGQLKLGLLSDLDPEIFADTHDEIMLWVDKHIDQIIAVSFPNQKFRVLRKEWERPITTDGRDMRLLGFVDLFVSLEDLLCNSSTPAIALVEVKTRIKPGSDIRQIKAYRTFLSEESERLHNFRLLPSILVSPDSRYSDLLKSQGIIYLPYEPTRCATNPSDA